MLYAIKVRYVMAAGMRCYGAVAYFVAETVIQERARVAAFLDLGAVAVERGGIELVHADSRVG